MSTRDVNKYTFCNFEIDMEHPYKNQLFKIQTSLRIN